MKKLALGILVAVIAACGGGDKKKDIIIVDSPTGGSSDGGDACNVLAQTGCAANEKCSWIHDATTPTPLGHVGCAPNGTVAVSGTCMYGPDGAMGYDNCLGGLVCQSGKCKTICDPAGGTPMCPAMFGCGTYEGLFGPVGQPVSAGVCDPSCAPLVDNDFLGSGSKPGTACPNNGSSVTGCYGYPATSHPTRWSCTREVAANHNIVHRNNCTTANGCANSAGNPYLNGCASGYIPLLYDMSGSTVVDCIAICEPGNTYMGNVATQYPDGKSPNRCRAITDRRGTFNPTATTTVNGEHCAFSWDFEIDTMGAFHRSPTSDTVGFCLNHNLYKYDSNHNGMIDAGDMTGWPLCASLPKNGVGSGSAHVFGADDFACVDTTAAGLPLNGKAQFENHALIERPRPLYHPVIKE
jgi:hypothetical protein